jgi:hypothetical protein
LARIEQKRKVVVPGFYFDARDGERFVPDEEGMEFEGIVKLMS